MSLVNNWKVKAGDISTAFLHAKAATDDLFMFPPTEFYNPEDQVVWKLNKAIYGLRSSPHAWQKHLAETLQQLGMERLASEPNVFKTTAGNAFVLCYVDDLLFLGEPTVVDKLFTDIQQHLLLRPTGDLTVGNTINFLGRNITNNGDYYEVSLSDKYTTDLLQEAGLANSKAAPAPGTKVSNTDLEQPLNTEEHKAYRRAVGKLQWMTYTRPDISYATKELARSLTEPTTADQQKLKHLLRYIRGTQHYKFYIRPTVKTSDITPDVDVYVDSDWAGCATTRKSTSGFVIKFMGAAIHFGSRTQSTIALSSAEAELYAINTGATEALHIRSFLTEALNKKKVNIRIHTDSSSGKSIATRIGSSKKAKHIELKHLFIQQLVLNDVVRIIKINTLVNPADIFTKYVATETLLRHLTEVGINTQPYWTLASTRSSFTWLQSAYRTTTTSITLHARTTAHTSSWAMDLVETSTWSISTQSTFTIPSFSSFTSSTCGANMIEDVCDNMFVLDNMIPFLQANMYFLIFEFRVQHFVEQQRDLSLQPFSSFNSPLNKLDFRLQQEVNMAVSLNTIEMNQHAKETQEFINEDRSTHDLNMEDFWNQDWGRPTDLSTILWEGQREGNVGNVNSLFMAYVDNRGVQLPSTWNGQHHLFGWINKASLFWQDHHYVQCCSCDSNLYVSHWWTTCDEPTTWASFYASLVYNHGALEEPECLQAGQQLHERFSSTPTTTWSWLSLVFHGIWKINNGILQDHHNRWEYNLSQRVWQIWMATRLCLVLQPAGESQQGTTSKHDNSTVQHHQLYDHADFWILRIGAVTVSQWNNKNSSDGTLQSQPHRFGCNTNKRPWKNQGTSKALNMVEKCSTKGSGWTPPDRDQQVSNDQHGSESTCTGATGWCQHGKASGQATSCLNTTWRINKGRLTSSRTTVQLNSTTFCGLQQK